MYIGCWPASSLTGRGAQVHFMVESTAAALSYGLLVAGHKAVLVFDMGGGTLDVTIMAVRSGTCQVLATAGHPKVRHAVVVCPVSVQ